MHVIQLRLESPVYLEINDIILSDPWVKEDYKLENVLN